MVQKVEPGQEKEVEFSLVSRHTMLFRMLLGRKALEHDFWVDVSRRNLLTGHARGRKTQGQAPHKRTRKTKARQT